MLFNRVSNNLIIKKDKLYGMFLALKLLKPAQQTFSTLETMITSNIY